MGYGRTEISVLPVTHLCSDISDTETQIKETSSRKKRDMFKTGREREAGRSSGVKTKNQAVKFALKIDDIGEN